MVQGSNGPSQPDEGALLPEALLPVVRDDSNATDTLTMAAGGGGSDLTTEALSVHGQLLLLPTSCPAEYGSVVRDCLQAEPAKRPAAAEVLQRLQRMADEMGIIVR